MKHFPVVVLVAFLMLAPGGRGAESIWVEAEHLAGIKGYCWPMGPEARRRTDGHWALSGPGWAAEWNQGGESGFLSIACGAGEARAAASAQLEIPEAGEWFVWVRYADWREQTERFEVRLEQAGRAAWTGRYGAAPVVEEDNEMKLYWGWAFGWARQAATLAAGAARLSLLATQAEAVPRQVDVIVLTTDAGYRPLIKERPRHATGELLESWRRGIPAGGESLARRVGNWEVPAAWVPKSFRDRGFLYLWNAGENRWWDPTNAVRVPYQIRDRETAVAFEKKFAGAKEIPIFSDARVVPTFHGTGPKQMLDAGEVTDAKENGKSVTTETKDAQKRVPTAQQLDARNIQKWLDEDPKRLWAGMINYAPDTPLDATARANFLKYRDRFVGRISGENLGYFNLDAKALNAAMPTVKSRREFAELYGRLAMAADAAKWRTVFGAELPEHYRDTIPCQSIEAITFAPLAYQWGARTVGMESTSCTAALLGMRWAFLRGAARQHGGLTATYRSCNFGDSATIFSDASTYSRPRNVFDNYYSVYSGAGMTWYKFDIWQQYMAGSSMFYHEQGFDEFWMPGGTTAAGTHEVQLSPKGKLVDRFLRLTAAEPDRGTPFTPVAFLLDYAHGWEPSPYQPARFGSAGDWGTNAVGRFDEHEAMLQEYFWTAYHPIGPKSEEPITSTKEAFVPGIFGDIFDCVFAYPDVKLWRTLDTYPVVIVAGDIELTAAEGERLARYIEAGGTVLLADAQLTGAGVRALALPELGASGEATGYRWLAGAAEGKVEPSQRYRFKAVRGGRPLAWAPDGSVVCAAFERGAGRLVFLGVPRGLGIDRRATPLVARLFAQLTRGLMPVEVEGEVEWLVNRAANSWLVTLLNPAGAEKPQQGITPTDYRLNKSVVIKSRVPIASARDRLLPTEALVVRENRVELTVQAGAVRVVEVR